MHSLHHQAIPAAQYPTVVLLHSSGSSARQWGALIEVLQRRFRVRAIEFYGHGQRTAWRDDAPLTLADEAACIVPMLAEAGGAHIVGHSYGAAVALKLASMYPRLVRSLVAYEPVLFRWLIDDDVRHRSAHDVVAVADAMRVRLARGQDNLAAQRFIDFWSGGGAWESLPSVRQKSIATRMRAVLRHFDALFSEPLRRTQLAGLRTPMLFMAGARTVAVTRRLAKLLRRALPRAQHDVLQEMGHMGPITHAALVNRRIVEFLDAHALSGSSLEPVREMA
jgi:pimeloyl-ACP methyl ester carboxylesterase